MAFIVEDGTGKPDANALISVADADAYHELRGNLEWASLEASKKQAAIVNATDYAEGVFGLAYGGRRRYSTQALSFPRVDMTALGQPVAFNAVPGKVAHAVAELALIASKGPLVKDGKRGKKRVKVGPLEVEYDGDSDTQTVFTSVILKFAPYLSGAGVGMGQIRLQRC